MRLTALTIISLYLFALACTKKNNTTINNNTFRNDASPAYVILGLHDIEFINGFRNTNELDITVQYMDSAQQTVQLSLSETPEGIEVDPDWIKSGIPTYSTKIRFMNIRDTTMPGSYPITLTATNDSGQQKVFRINVNINAIPASVLGKYSNCRMYCPGTTVYTDSIYRDPTVANKLWFTNFGNWGNLVYGYLTGNGRLTIPEQTSGTMTYNYSGLFYLNDRHINMSFGSSCAMDME